MVWNVVPHTDPVHVTKSKMGKYQLQRPQDTGHYRRCTSTDKKISINLVLCETDWCFLSYSVRKVQDHLPIGQSLHTSAMCITCQWAAPDGHMTIALYIGRQKQSQYSKFGVNRPSYSGRKVWGWTARRTNGRIQWKLHILPFMLGKARNAFKIRQC